MIGTNVKITPIQSIFSEVLKIKTIYASNIYINGFNRFLPFLAKMYYHWINVDSCRWLSGTDGKLCNSPKSCAGKFRTTFSYPITIELVWSTSAFHCLFQNWLSIHIFNRIKLTNLDSNSINHMNVSKLIWYNSLSLWEISFINKFPNFSHF